ncbi:hypothetical protein QUF56_17380 [Ureibacillus composti]|nr:hypothetical protein [Ureibacillus composti]
MKFNKEEQETIINYCPETDEWSFYTCVPSHIKSFMKNPILNKVNFDIRTSHEGKPTSIEFTVENAFVTNSFFKKKRTISDSHKQALLNGRMAKKDKVIKERNDPNEYLQC